MRKTLFTSGIGAAAVALGFGAAIAASAPAASADTGAASQADAAQHRSSPQSGRATQTRNIPRAAAATQRRSAAPQAAVQAAAQPRLSISSTWQGPYRLRSGSTGAAELSGIAYDGGTSYYAVGDNAATSIWQITAGVGARSGRISTAAVSGGITAPAMGSDAEGIALRPGSSRAWVADEIASSITEFDLSNGTKTGSVAVPEIYRPANVQGNFGLEALSYGADRLWTSNEEALKPDGSISTTRSGSWVRVQQFSGENLSPATQYAYRTDKIAGMSPFIDVERSGLVDMLALPDGRVLALEREVGGFLPTFRSRIYQLDFGSATDVSALPTLTDGGFTAVKKKLLWQGFFLLDNFEGITLGPRLNNGSYSVLLVSDDGSGQNGQRQDLYSLVLRGVQNQPTL